MERTASSCHYTILEGTGETCVPWLLINLGASAVHVCPTLGMEVNRSRQPVTSAAGRQAQNAEFGALPELKRPAPCFLTFQTKTGTVAMANWQAAPWQLALLAHSASTTWRWKRAAGMIAWPTPGPD